ncbi:hypothetical protein PRIPAC_83739 [Pristionchus pacificus]|uniref:Uncharacterized protein n=1 Tax=Pristionchus pacificus TaxID=54126 RepID=A0A2A6BGS0_PRIPA|nr:hypothetical protein PRIPAC_83739 [Pristionchus pacificus]|eukprot:PDM65077.1 hypothetical protein PRIPAC_53326 [Pristionchus pacificus]
MFLVLLFLLSPLLAVVWLKYSELYDEIDFKNVAQSGDVRVYYFSLVDLYLSDSSQANGVFARTVGYDAIHRNNADNCYPAMDTDFGNSFDGFTISVNGPLLTLAFDSKKYPNSKVDLKAGNGFGFDRFPFPNQPVYISSPGFVCGSPSSSQVYRSSSLAKSDDYTLKTPDIKFYGNFQDHTNSVQMQLQTPGVIVSFTPGTVDSFFGKRVRVEDVKSSTVEASTTTTTTMVTKITSSPEVTTSSTGTYTTIVSTIFYGFVRLQNSVLYDEVDFKNVPQLSTDMCASGCKVYATIWKSSDYDPIMKNILVYDPNMDQNSSVFHLSSIFMQGYQEKAYLEMGNVPTVTIYNTNANLESGPLALWIVSTKSPYYHTAEVYEPQRLERNLKIAPYPITILSARPFTVNAKHSDDGNAVFARTVGFDAIDRDSEDNCYPAMDKDFGDYFGGFSLAINGPLLTIHFDTDKYPNSQVKISASPSYNYDQTLKGPLFVSSPGFVCGSASSSEVFRSRELATGVQYTLITKDNKEMLINFDMDVVSDEDHPVRIFDPNSNVGFGFYGSFADSSNSLKYSVQTNRVTVTFVPRPGDSFFGMRVWAEDVGDNTSFNLITTTSSTSHQPLVVVLFSIFVLVFGKMV